MLLLSALTCTIFCACVGKKQPPDTTEGTTVMTDVTTALVTDETVSVPYIDIIVLEDATVRGGSYSKMNYGKEQTIEIKGSNDDYARKAYLKFSLEGITEKDPVSVTLELTSRSGQTTEELITVEVGETDSDWSEKTITFDERPRFNKIIARKRTYAKQTCSIDVTEYVKQAIADGKDTVSFGLQGTEGWKLNFNSKESNSSVPKLRIAYVDMSSYFGRKVVLPKASRYGEGNDQWEWADKLVNEYFASYKAKEYEAPSLTNSPAEYSVSVKAKKEQDEAYKSYNLRTLSTLTDYIPATATLDKYGGNTAMKFNATGYFRTEFKDGRWYLVTPDGNAYFNTAMANVTVDNSSQKAKNGFNSLYGSNEKWAKLTSELLKDNGFYSMGAWSKHETVNLESNKMSYSEIVYFATTYGEAYKLTAQSAGHATFVNNNTIPVFDPDFVTVANRLAKNAAKEYGDDPYFIGYMSDNELPCDKKMLDNYLTLDWSNVHNTFSYATAWVWLEKATGKSAPTLSDVTDKLRDSFREFVYDRYFKVVSTALKTADPNHLYLGCRFMKEANLSEGIFRAAGRYCDAISINYYLDLDPDNGILEQWITCAGKPFIITEVYTKGEDSGLPNTAGAGYTVKTQKERGIFYQNFMLKMIESKYCVGVHWFKYRDNDPQKANAEASNTDANKGIVGVDYSEYTELLEYMKEINLRVYGLMEHFDRK